jgi:hypothetical protein
MGYKATPTIGDKNILALTKSYEKPLSSVDIYG